MKEGHIKFTPEMYAKTYLNWMENIHDWCISRQLWWGHRIPAWECAACHKITVSRTDPSKCAHCGSEKIEQSTDVLDTWFSSGLLPVSVFGWPNIAGAPQAGAPGPSPLGTWESDRRDFDAFYPTSVLVTGFDILFFWVARMIMMGCWFSLDVPNADGSQRSLADSVPFREVYIHALVRDANREKMSKTKGNVIDPIEIVQQYGTDAVRFTLASMASPGTDIAFNVARTEGYRAFANKIWNAARFIFMNVDKAAEIGISVDTTLLGSMPKVADDAPLEARWIVEQLHRTSARVNEALSKYRFDDAADEIYGFFWGSFCDWYIESAKLRLDFSESGDKSQTERVLVTLLSVFESSLRLLSPFMPFITEELWHRIYAAEPPFRSIALAPYPQARVDWLESANRGAADPNTQMISLQELKTEVLSLRKELGVEERTSVTIVLRAEPYIKHIVDANPELFAKLAKVAEIQYVSNVGQIPTELAKRMTADFDVAVVYERKIDVAAECERLNKEIARQEKIVANADRQLNNPGFTAKAPAHIVEGLKKQRDDAQQLLEKLQRDRASLGC